MKQFIPNKTVKVSFLEKLHGSFASFTFIEKVVFGFFALLLVVTTLYMLGRINNMLSTVAPREGGHITEGVVGTPRFINPILALSDSDRDVTALVYSGLMRATPDGSFVPDLAESYRVSEDGLEYTFTIREDAEFHDGTPVTAADVVFTIERAQHDLVKSPKRANWEGVLVEAVNEKEVRFVLAQVYVPFISNTTLGILPKHLWDVTEVDQMQFSKYNTEPVGSGPFVLQSTAHNNIGVPEAISLSAFEGFALGRPFVDEITIRFYGSEEELITALRRGTIDHASVLSPEGIATLADDRRVETVSLPRVFGVFFNQNEASVFTDSAVREALSLALDRNQIIRDVLYGYGIAIDSPIPAAVLDLVNTSSRPVRSTVVKQDIRRAEELLFDAGWEMSEEFGVLVKETDEETTLLSFTLSTSNIPELKAAAEQVAAQWRAIGAQVDVQLFDTSDLNQKIIRPRDYQALLFGEIIGRDLDPFAFWHSSQRLDPGLNIALYTNIEADGALEGIRTTFNKKEREEHYQTLEKEIRADNPATFILSPEFIYIVDKNLKGMNLGLITTNADRFLDVHKWHLYADRVWTVFN